MKVSIVLSYFFVLVSAGCKTNDKDSKFAAVFVGEANVLIGYSCRREKGYQAEQPPVVLCKVRAASDAD